MGRKTKNFITAYEEFTKSHEGPALFHTWTSLFMLAAAVRRKVWFDQVHFKIYPNLYIVFISPPGRGKKSSSAEIGIDILKELGDIRLSSESVTREALIKDLAGSSSTYMTPEGIPVTHCSLSIFSSEWSVFLGHKNSGNEPMIALLTDLFGCPNRWTYRTKLSGTDTLENVFLNKLACTTFDYLASSLPMDAIGGGLTSRVIFVVEFKKRQKAPLLEDLVRPEDIALREFLKQDLEHVSLIQGKMTFSPEAKQMYIDWYNSLDEDNPPIKDERFFGYFERKPTHVIKVAMLMSIAESDSRIIEVHHLAEALNLFTRTEKNMPHAFGGRGRSALAVDLERILLQIVQHWKAYPNTPIPKRIIARNNYRNCDPDSLRKILEQLELMGEIQQKFQDGDWQIYYVGEFTKGKEEDKK
jgi:hypothetical protein